MQEIPAEFVSALVKVGVPVDVANDLATILFDPSSWEDSLKQIRADPALNRNVSLHLNQYPDHRDLTLTTDGHFGRQSAHLQYQPRTGEVSISGGTTHGPVVGQNTGNILAVYVVPHETRPTQESTDSSFLCQVDAPTVQEVLHSSLLPVLKMPRFVYGVPCDFVDAERKQVDLEIIRPVNPNELYPYLIRDGMLFCFQNLNNRQGPFQKVVGNRAVERYNSRDWWQDPDRLRWFVDLLNRGLNKLTGRRGLNLDKEHHRYYFQPEAAGKARKVVYRPLNQTTSSIHVVWQPITKKTGLPKPFWYHRAVSLKYQLVSEDQWCLSIRPELHITKDSLTPEESYKIGSRVTRKKARMFNYDLLGETNFWRDYLSFGQPRIIMRFGEHQHIVISTKLMQTQVEWPGIPEEYSRPFKNIEYPEDLFTWADLEELSDQEVGELEDADDWEGDEDDEEWV